MASILRILYCPVYTAQYILDAGTSDAVYAIEVNVQMSEMGLLALLYINYV